VSVYFWIGMRISPASGTFVVGLAIGAAAILALGFFDLWLRPDPADG